MDDLEFFRRDQKLVDKPYALANLAQGFDCLNYILEFYGSKIPKEFKGIDAFNYAQLWNNDEIKARVLYKEYLSSLGKPIDRNYALRGDLMFFESPKSPFFAAIYDGCGAIRINLGKKHGVRKIPLAMIQNNLIEVRRIEP